MPSSNATSSPNRDHHHPHQSHQQQQQQHSHQPKEMNKPKGRMSAYTFFVQKCRDEHRKAYPNENANFSEFSKKCAEKWKVSRTSDLDIDQTRLSRSESHRFYSKAVRLSISDKHCNRINRKTINFFSHNSIIMANIFFPWTMNSIRLVFHTFLDQGQIRRHSRGLTPCLCFAQLFDRTADQEHDCDHLVLSLSFARR